MTRTEKSQACIDECISKMNDEDKEIYRPIAEYALELGYTPKSIKKAGGDISELAFSKSKIGRTLFRILPMNLKEFPQYPTKIAGRAQMRLVFFATYVYTEPFSFGIKCVIENFGGKYIGCYGCGRCNGNLQGYTYVYPDGKTVFRCGCELIELPPLGAEHVDEVKAMMKAQDDFWMKECDVL